jgi:hypothetical protein
LESELRGITASERTGRVTHPHSVNEHIAYYELIDERRPTKKCGFIGV